jgi:hypothetical protein
MSKKEQIWVHPDFKKKLKVEAGKEGLSMIQLTKKLANQPVMEEQTNEQKKSFNMRF